MEAGGMLVVAILGGVFAVALVATWLGARHESRKRELDHLERMKALEVGVPLPGDPLSESLKALRTAREARPGSKASEMPAALARKFLTAAIALPAGAVAASVVFGLHGPEAIAMWAAVATVATTCVICGTIVALVPPRGAGPGSADAAAPPGAEKPRFDADFAAPPVSTFAHHRGGR